MMGKGVSYGGQVDRKRLTRILVVFFVDLVSLKKYLFIVLIFFSCASNRKSAITEQEDFIKSHPNWKGHTFGFKERELSIDVFEVIEAIKQEKKIQSIQDSIFVIDEKEK